MAFDVKAQERCANRFLKSYLRIQDTSDVLLRKHYKHKRNQRHNIRSVALKELENDLIEDFGSEVYYKVMESFYRVLN
jgi:hypothetical protein